VAPPVGYTCQVSVIVVVVCGADAVTEMARCELVVDNVASSPASSDCTDDFVFVNDKAASTDPVRITLFLCLSFCHGAWWCGG